MSEPTPIPRDGGLTPAPLDDWDFPENVTCNPNKPEECEACQ